MGDTKQKPVIEFENFEFQYFSQAEPTLHNLNLTIHEHEKVLIVGASGSGKSTIGNCLNGLIPYAFNGKLTGELRIFGTPTTDMSIFELSKRVGTVLQDSDGQFVGLSVGEDIAFALENDLVAIDTMHEQVEKTAALMDMDKHLKSSPKELSGGQKQRVAMAGVMIDDVDILLFDEPLANLDPATGKTAIDLIDKIWQDSNKTVVIIEHRLEDVLYRHVDRVIVVDEGRIVVDTTPDKLMTLPALKEQGIREPLYVTALKYAGVPITEDIGAGHLDTLQIDKVKDALLSWHENQQAPPQKSANKEILSIENLYFQYSSKHPLLQDISLNIREKEMVSIVGTNGAGKSTLAKVICGFVKENSGRIILDGQDLKDATIKERAKKIGFVMQNPNQMICKPMIYDEVALGLRNQGMSEEEIAPKIDKALKICGLAPFKKWPIAALSFGQKKRVTIASILVMDPEVLILDEPTAGQDYRHYTDIMEFLKKLNDTGVTIILITHDMHLMLEYTPHSIVLSAGRKIGDETAVAILTNEDIAKQGNLKLTSLYELAIKVGISDPTEFVQHFIDYERGTKHE